MLVLGIDLPFAWIAVVVLRQEKRICFIAYMHSGLADREIKASENVFVIVCIFVIITYMLVTNTSTLFILLMFL